MILPRIPSTPTKQTTYSLILTNSNIMLYYSRLIRALGLCARIAYASPPRGLSNSTKTFSPSQVTIL